VARVAVGAGANLPGVAKAAKNSTAAATSIVTGGR
jgi:hypothetical protein